MEGLRKEKASAQNILERIKKKCQETENKLEMIRSANYFALKNKEGKICKLIININTSLINFTYNYYI